MTAKPDRSTVASLEGRELDAALHVHMFGLRYCQSHLGGCPHGDEVQPFSTSEGPPFFAMLRAVRERGFDIMILNCNDGSWSVTLSKKRALSQSGPTLPLALARAALLTTYEQGSPETP